MPKGDIENNEVTAEKVAKSLNASVEAKDAVEKAEKSVQQTKEEVTETKETLKSLAGSIETLVTEMSKKKSEDDQDSIKELKSEIALLKAQKDADNQGKSGGASSEMETKSKRTLELFSKSLENKSSHSFGKEDEKESSLYNKCGVLERKSLNTFDNSNAGAFVPAKRIIGEVNVNLQTVNPVTSIVNNVAGGSIVAGSLGYTTYDESNVSIKESAEGKGAEQSQEVVMDEINIYVAKESAKIKISDKTLHSSLSGELTTNPLNQNLNAIERRYEKGIARKVLNGKSEMGVYGIFNKAQESGFNGSVVETENDNVVKLKDFANLSSQLKVEYLMNAAILVDRAVLYELHQEAGNDGHLKIEQFDYNNGIAALRTPERVIPLIGVNSSPLETKVNDNDGFANYETFSGSGTILSGYTKSFGTGTDNAGKALAVLADFSLAYSLVRSSVVQLGYDQSFGNLINNGYVWGGKVGYVGGKPTTTEAMAILTCK